MYSNFCYIAEIPPNFGGDVAPYRAVFTVQRMQGLFEDVTVNWTVVNATSDISPTEGSVLFRGSQNSATFYIDSVSDNVRDVIVACLACIFSLCSLACIFPYASTDSRR